MDVATLESIVRLIWLAAAALFVLGLMRMNSPATARNGNLLSAGGMAVAIGATAFLIAARQVLDPASFGIRASSWALIIADRKSTRLNSSHPSSSYAVFCLKK